MKDHAKGWFAEREEFRRNVATKSQQKITDEKVKSAVIEERVRQKLLTHIEKEIDNLPTDEIGTEVQTKTFQYSGDRKIAERVTTIKLRDLVSCYKDLQDENFRREKLDLDKKRAEDDW